MSYRAQIQGLVNSVVTSMIGDLNSTAVFKQVTLGAYDATTGVQARTTNTYTCQCVLVRLTQKDFIMDQTNPEMKMSGITATSQKMLVPTLQLPGVDVNSLADQVIIDGDTYNIFSTMRDPSGSLYSFIVQAVGGVTLSGMG